MAVILFQDRFAELVRSGEKRQTIRLPRKRPIQQGQALSLRRWTGSAYRSRQETLLDTYCLCVRPVHITATKLVVGSYGELPLNHHDAHTLAVSDGFENVADMIAWFRRTHGLPFHGIMIDWKYPGANKTATNQ